jgi:hypothetical protein
MGVNLQRTFTAACKDVWLVCAICVCAVEAQSLP